MKVRSEQKADKDLPEWQSHLMVEMPEAGLTFDFRGHLDKKISIVGETIVHDEKSAKWLIFSVSARTSVKWFSSSLKRDFVETSRESMPETRSLEAVLNRELTGG